MGFLTNRFNPALPVAVTGRNNWRNRLRPRAVFAAVTLVVLSAGCGGNRKDASAPESRPAAGRYAAARRIVSLSPTITETLFALGLGDRVVGVTRFCDYPPEARRLPKVGGFYDPNIEAVAALDPDLAVLLENHEAVIPKLRTLGIPMLTVRCDTVDDIFAAIRTIGDACGRSARADRLLDSLRQRLAAVRARTAGLRRPRVMICVGRAHDVNALKDIYIAGRDGFYDRLLEAAGATPAYDKPGIRFPQISQEGIAELNPDVIVELAPDLDKTGLSAADLKNDWSQIPEIAAVKTGRVHVLTGDYVTIPGPRFVELLEDLARIAHPGEKKQKP